MHALIKWLLMLNKRLYKKATFVVILALIPICVFLFSLVARQDSGFMQIVLAQTDADDALSTQMVAELMGEDSLIQFTKASSPAKAVEAVKMGQADEAWIFPADLQEKLAAKDPQGVVSIVTREQSTLQRISREKLTSALFKHYAKAYYIRFARASDPKLAALSDEALSAYFDNINLNEDLFMYDNPGTSFTPEPNAQNNYLTTPIRGLLGILVVLCGMAAALYYIQDDNAGLFSWIPETSKIFVAFCCLLIAVLNVAVVVTVSLRMAGLGVNLFKEMLSILLYAICCTVFCLTLKQIFRSIKLYGAMIPLLMVVMIAVCPVFFDFRSLTAVQLLLPPTYYVNAAYDNKYLLYMVLYSVAGAALCIGLEFCQRPGKYKLFHRRHS